MAYLTVDEWTSELNGARNALGTVIAQLSQLKNVRNRMLKSGSAPTNWVLDLQAIAVELDDLRANISSTLSGNNYAHEVDFSEEHNYLQVSVDLTDGTGGVLTLQNASGGAPDSDMVAKFQNSGSIEIVNSSDGSNDIDGVYTLRASGGVASNVLKVDTAFTGPSGDYDDTSMTIIARHTLA